MPLELFYPGLVGIYVGETNLFEFEGGTLCRGIPVSELIREASLPEMVYTLWSGDWPTSEELADFESLLVEQSTLPPSIMQFINDQPIHTPLWDTLRTSISLLSHFDDQYSDRNVNGEFNKAIKILSRVPLMLAYRQGMMSTPPELQNSFMIGLPSFMGELLLGDESTPAMENLFQSLMIMHACREFDTASFTARVMASNHSDLYSCIMGAIGAISGSGSLNCYHEWSRYAEKLESDSPESFQKTLHKILETDRAQLGFHTEQPAHAVHKKFLLEQLQPENLPNANYILLERFQIIDRTLWEQKNLSPTIDNLTARLMYMLEIPSDVWMYLPLIGMIINWSGHVLEQREDNTRYQPKLRYRGAHGLHVYENKGMSVDPNDF
jgi:citrate synthase